MAHLRYVTLTGVDERTSFAALTRLSAAYRFVEWGVLYDPRASGQENRFPQLDWIENFAKKAARKRMNVALHLCGGAVKSLLRAVNSLEGWTEPDVARLERLANLFGRVQLNTVVKESDVPALRGVIQRLTRCEKRTRVILQWHPRHEEVCRQLDHEYGFEALVDSSGGRGLEREDWPVLHRELRRFGYAGGLGPHNLAAQLPGIAAGAGDKTFWVDMESSLRDKRDRFQVLACEQVLAQASDFIARQRQEQGSLWGTGSQSVHRLSGLWLSWWAGLATGYPMVIPPRDACRPMCLYRPTGSYESVDLAESHKTVIGLLAEHRIALEPQDSGAWKAWLKDSPDCSSLGSTIEEAGLRCVVRSRFGDKVPRNPARLMG